MNQPINIIFDGPPAHESGRFIEVETDDGQSVNAGEWIDRGDGTWALRITELPAEPRKFTVVCADAQVRHEATFATEAEGRTGGHCCTSLHFFTIDESQLTGTD